MVRPRLRRRKGGVVTIPRPKGPNSDLLWKTGSNPSSESSHRRPVNCPAIQAPQSTLATAANRPRYNDPVPFTVRDFQPADFETLWRIDQDCFPPGISYSRAELKLYMRRRGSFTLVAGRSTAVSSGQKVLRLPAFIVAEADVRGHGHIITIDVVAAARRFGVGSLLLRAAEDRLRRPPDAARSSWKPR